MWSAVLVLAALAAPADPGPFRCEATDVAGVPADDAVTAVAITCDELAAVSRRSGAYGVSVRALGESMVMTVRRLDTGESRRLVLDGLKEVPTAARRLAEAVVLGKPVEDTRLVDNLVESEGRKLVTQSGSVKFELGALALAAGSGTGAGFSTALSYDTPTFAIPAELRFASSSSGSRTTSFFSVASGARFFSSKRDVSPFVGGGFSVLYLSRSDQGDAFGYSYLEDSHWGPGLYAEAGVQIFRLHRGRLTARVRADFPLYSLHPTGYDSRPRGGPTPIDGGAVYLVPVTFGLTMSF